MCSSITYHLWSILLQENVTIFLSLLLFIDSSLVSIFLCAATITQVHFPQVMT